MIDFSNVKSIVIPEGEVSVIARGAEILWRKQRYKCEVEYLESTGGQWLDMRLPLTNNSKVDVVFSVNQNMTSSIFGARDSASSKNIGVAISETLASSGKTLYADFNNSDYSIFRATASVEVGKRCRFVIDKNRRIAYDENGNVIAENATICPDVFSTSGTALLFQQRGGFAGEQGLLGRVYQYKQHESGILVRDLIPVIDWNDRPCMYDKVTDELFYNQGTGEFLYGE